MCCVPCLRETRRQKIERGQDLIVPLGARLHAVSILVGKGPARLLFRLVDHLTRFADLHQPGQTKRAPGHVLHQTLDPCSVARRQEHRLIDAETTVLPSAHVLDDFWLDLVLGQIKGKDRFLPGDLEPI